MDIRQLTFLRFLAASAVIVFHTGRNVPSLSWGAAFWPNANTAVSFFFVLSGFVLAHVYGRTGVRSVRDFYVARLARIAPVYWLALLVMVAYAWHRHELTAAALVLNIALLQAWIPGYVLSLNSPGWTLSVEVFFYLCFPWLLQGLRSLGRPGRYLLAMGAIWGVSQLLHVALTHSVLVQSTHAGRQFTDYNPVMHLGSFMVGMLGGLLFEPWHQRLRSVAAPLVLLALAGLGALFLLPNPLLAYHHNGLPAPLYLMLIWGLAAAPQSAVARFMVLPPLVLLGESSYGLYILQEPVEVAHDFIANRAHWGVELNFWSYYLLLLAVSVAVFVLFERPLRERIRRALAGPRATPLPVVAA